MFTSVEHAAHPHPEAMVYCVFANQDAPQGFPDEAKQATLRPEFKAKSGQLVEAFPASGPRMIMLGMGELGKTTVESVRKAGLKLAQHIDDCEIEIVHFAENSDLDTRDFGQAMGVALQLTSYSARQMPGTRSETDPEQNLKVKALSEGFDKGLARGIAIGRAVNFTRRLVNTPPNIASPLWMAQQAEELAARTTGLKVTVLQGEELERERLVGIVNVGKASSQPPCLIRIEWKPETSTDAQPVVIVGKTITYDTGGLSIKSKTGMPGMKHDKAGGCAVLGLMQAVAEVVRPNFPVVALLTAAENCIDAIAYRPDDVITYRNGVTVEVTNTDAEGRLVMADGLCWACDVENPECILDIATLTGGVITALGGEFAGIFSEHDGLTAEVSEAGVVSGEELWRLPLTEGFRDMMKGSVCDVVNSVPGGRGHASQAAAFLSFFVKPDVPYAHIDMAGLSHSRRDEYTFEGPSGWGVRLLTQFLTARSENN